MQVQVTKSWNFNKGQNSYGLCVMTVAVRVICVTESHEHKKVLDIKKERQSVGK